MTAKKVTKYAPYGEELSAEVAYLQAASILDIAVPIAVEAQEIERLETLAVLWMELGQRLLDGPEEEDAEQQPPIIGFHRNGHDDERTSR